MDGRHLTPWLVLLLTANLRADVLEPYARRADLTGRWSNGSLHEVTLPDTVLTNRQAFPTDLRIVDETGQEWPFYLHHPGTGAPRLVFQAGSGHRPRLYFDSPLFRLPRYDLQRRVGPGLPASAQPAGLGNPERNPAHLSSLLHTYTRTLLRVTLLLLALLAGLLGWKRWRRRS